MMSICDVSIVMLTHNGASFTRHAFEGLLKGESKPKELFLVDNCSEDDTPALIQEYLPKFRGQGIQVITWRNDENKGCSLARNEAWSKATGKYTVFEDNDCVVCSHDWLEKMIHVFEEQPTLGVLGPKIIYPYQPHNIQCAGVSINHLGRVAFRGRGADRQDPRYSTYWKTWSLISACWMMPTDLRERVGYLDEYFHPVQYEDLDLCVRARLKGLDVAYTPDVEMYHFEGITTASFGAEEYKVNIARNSLKFRERYHALFKTFTDELPPEEYRWLRHQELGLRMELDLTMI